MLLASNSDNPITNAEMILLLTTHMAITDMINRSIIYVTGNTLNTAGITCPTITSKLGKTVFVTPQDCNICGKNQYHIPANCLEAPQNAAIKAKVKAKWAAEKALKEAQAAATT